MAYNDIQIVTDLFLHSDGNTPFEVDKNAFMENGGGRFAVGRNFELVNDFFTTDNTILAPGTYTKAQIANILNLDRYDYVMNQYNFQDNTDDYLERTYIYNTMSFQISDDAVFVIEANGRRRIDNFSIEPRLDVQENFDFSGGNSLTNGLNKIISVMIDPHDQGQSVPIIFTGTRNTVTYDGDSYFNDLLIMSSWEGSDFSKLKTDLSLSIHEMENANIIDKTKWLVDEASDSISSAYDWFKNAVARSQFCDPLIIDMSGNGLHLDSWQNSGAAFDLNADGTPENTGWTQANSDDSFLVVDKNGNGNIDNISEMFGNMDIAGFDELRKYDSNSDNLINSADSQFNLLKIWRDANANGVVDAGEMSTLSANNITSISLQNIKNNIVINGNIRSGTSTVNFADGSQKVIHEVSFGFDNTTSISSNPDSTLPANFQLDINAILLPYSRGYGSLYSWQAAMSLDAQLLQMAQNLVNLQPIEFYKINDLFQNFLFRWAGVENVTAEEIYQVGGGQIQFDPRKMAFLEKVTDLDFVYTNRNSIPLAQQSWDLFYNIFLSRFLTQGTLAAAFPDATYDFATDNVNINASLDATIAHILELSNTLNQSNFLNYAYYSKTILQLNHDQFTDPAFDSKIENMLGSLINSVAIENFAFNGTFNIGSNEDDPLLFGSINADIIKGLDGNDAIFALAGNDYIEGGKGDDYLKGEAGNDIYKYNLGDGQDTIDDNSGTDKIIFGTGITAAMLSFVQTGNDLVINIGSNGDKIGIKNFYTATTNRVESISFADGSQYNLGVLGSIINGTAAGESIYGTYNNDIIYAGDGNDFISSDYGDDVITGGKGNDNFQEYGGNDTYIFNIGDGQDVIFDYAGIDKIIFGAGIVASDITLVPENYSLLIKIGTNGDQIRINNFFTGDSYVIESLQFADGSLINFTAGITLNGTNISGETIRGTYSNDQIIGNIGNDAIYASYGNDVITGGKGNDYMEDNVGSDTYIFNIGDGQDVISDYAGSDKILFGAGISAADITLVPNDYALIVKIGLSGDQIRINNFFNGNSYLIESLQFADGSTINLSASLTLNGTNTSGETIRGTDYSDVIIGNIGNDAIYSKYGNDLITGGKGNDYLDDVAGDDTYIFNIGDGQDLIYDYSGIDKIIFGAGISTADITLVPNDYSLIVKIGFSGDQIRINNFFNSSSYVIETLQFADGSTMNLSTSITLNGTNTSGENIRGTFYNDIITGNIGNDAIYANYGDDVIAGGKGNDYLEDNAGNDTYIFNIGDGQDVISDYSGIDKILFGAGISAADITLVPNDYSLIIKIGNNGDQIRIHNFLNGNSYLVESLQFADGSTMNISGALTLNGTNTSGENIRGTFYNDIITGNIGNDAILSNYGDDVIAGGKGNDYLEGNNGNDTYIFNIGDGQDFISDYAGIDKILFGAGISAADITLVPNDYSLIIKIGNNGDQITINSFLNGNSYLVESLQFADGSTMNLAANLTLNGTNISGENIRGTVYSDIITGNIGNDAIYSNYGNDLVTGGKGNDYLEDIAGDDSYLFNIGDGQDVISDYAGIDKIIFGAGIEITNILMEAAGNNLIIKFNNSSDQITINSFFNGPSYQIEYLQFNDGSSFRITSGLNINGSPFNDNIIGTPFNDIFNGNAGNDYLYTSDGADTLNGGSGDDFLAGGNGADTYIFDAGFGNDILKDQSGVDTILMGTGLLANSMAFVRSGNNLSLIQQNSGDTININDFFSSAGNRIEYIQFADGTKFNLANILNTDPLSLYSINGYSQVTEDTATRIKLLNQNDLTNNYNNIAISGAAAHGIASVDASGNLSYSPAANYNGPDSFAISYTDNLGVAKTKVINLNVAPVNDAPLAQNLNLAINEDAVTEIFPLTSATDVDGNILSINFVSTPTYGAVQIVAGGKLIYVPKADFYGVDVFNYTINDGNGGFDTKTITINVLPVNDAPVAVDDAITINEDETALINITANDNDAEDGFFVASNMHIVQGPLNGTVSIGSDGRVLYTPNTDFYGQDNFTYNITDSAGVVSNTATVTVNVNMVNDAPKIILSKSMNFTEDMSKSINISDYFYDPEGDAFQAIAVIAAHGQAQISANGFTYTPNNNFNGNETFQITLRDSFGATRVITANALVTPVNDAPVASADNFTVLEDVPASLNILANDTDIEDVLFVQNITLGTPAHGRVQINNLDNTITYIPDSNFSGTDSFEYTITDPSGASSTALVTLNVTAVNDAPIVINVAPNQNIIAGEAFNLSFSSNIFSDADGDFLSYSLKNSDGSAAPAWLSFDPATMLLSGTAPTGFSGILHLNLIANDGNGGVTSSEFDMNVTANVSTPSVSITKISGAPVSGNEIIYSSAGAISLAKLNQNLEASLIIENPDGQTVMPDIISQQRLTLAHDGDVTVTFKNSVASFSNSLGWYVVAADGTITNPQILFTNAHAVATGTEFNLGNLAAGTQIGFFVVGHGAVANWMAEGHANIGMRQLDLINGSFKFIDSNGGAANMYAGEAPILVYSLNNVDYLLNKSVYLSGNNAKLNPDNLVHTGAGWDGVHNNLLVGFEDLYGGGDKDYNDLLFNVDLGEANNAVKYAGAPFLANDLKITPQQGVDVTELTINISGAKPGDQIVFEGYEVVGNLVVGTQAAVATSLVGGILQLKITGIDSNIAADNLLHSLKLVNLGGDAVGTRDVTLVIHDSTGADTSSHFKFAVTSNHAQSGTAANDNIFGTEDSDVINAGAGDDVIHGGWLADLLTGGTGADSFNFSSLKDSNANAFDIITDFEKGTDHINLHDLAQAGIINFDDLTITHTATETIIASNNANQNEQFELHLNGVINLDNDDFWFGTT